MSGDQVKVTLAALRKDDSMGEPKVLYKYMSPERALQVLPEGGNGALRASQPATLNDPFECAAELSTPNSNDDRGRKEIIETLKLISPKARLSDRDLTNSMTGIGPQKWSELLRKVLSFRFGIVSFSANPLHPLLWSHYGDSGKGVAIGYDIAVLKQIPTQPEILGAVDYGDHLPKLPDSSGNLAENELRRLMLKKSGHWKYEDEWRLVLDLSNTTGTGRNDENGYPICLCSIPNEAVVQVIVTERSPQGIPDTLHQRLIGRHGYRGWPLDTLTLAPDKYGYGYLDFDFTREGELSSRINYTRPKRPWERPPPPNSLAAQLQHVKGDS